MASGDWAVVLRPAAKSILESLLEGRKSLTQMAEATQLSKPSLLPHLKELTSLGVIHRFEVRTSAGRKVEYALAGGSLHLELHPEAGVALSWASNGPSDPEYPLASQVVDPQQRGQVHLVLRLLDQACEADAAWDAAFVILFGSMARDEATWKSDMDLLVVLPDGPHDSLKERLLDAAADIQEAVTHAVRPHFTTRRDFLAGRRRIDAEAAKEGLVLRGSIQEGDLWRKMERYRRIRI